MLIEQPNWFNLKIKLFLLFKDTNSAVIPLKGPALIKTFSPNGL